VTGAGSTAREYPDARRSPLSTGREIRPAPFVVDTGVVRPILLLWAIAAALPAVALGSGPGAQRFEAHLLGKSEIPKGAPNGKGTVKIAITGAKVCWKFVSVVGIDKPLVSHIHKGGAKTAAGPVVVPLGDAFRNSGCTVSTVAVDRAIERHPSRYYVNIHTPKYPLGAIRGQLHAAD
jgi:hypothetical protein